MNEISRNKAKNWPRRLTAVDPGSLGCTGTGSPIVNHVGPSTSHRQGYNMASAMPADSSENLQSSQKNVGSEPATIARDRSLQTRGKYSRRGTCDMTKVPLQDRMNRFPNQHLIVRGTKIFCDACKEIVSSKKSILKSHCESRKHASAKEKLKKSKLREQNAFLDLFALFFKEQNFFKKVA